MPSSVLLITDIFPPMIGGPASFIDRLGHNLASKGHRVSVICSSSTPTHESDKDRPFRVRRICLTSPIRYFAKLGASLTWEMLRHNTILVNGLEYPAGRVAAMLRKKYVLKIVGDYVWEAARNEGSTSETVDDFQREQSQGQDPRLQAAKARRSLYLAQSRQIITPSNYLKSLVTSWGVDPARIRVVPNGVIQTDENAPFPKRRADEPLKVGFVGRLTNWKGVETLMLAASGLQDVHVTIVGDGPEFPILNQLCSHMQLASQVTFAGRLNADAVHQFLNSIHVLVLPSSYEGMSHTLLEAGTVGLPCIASNCGGNPEVIVHDHNGLLFPYGDVALLRSAIKQLRDDEPRRIAMSHNARKHAQRFDFDKTVHMTLAVLMGTETP